jgi:hypothetical protein
VEGAAVVPGTGVVATPMGDGLGVAPGPGEAVGAGPAQDPTSAAMARIAGRAPALLRVEARTDVRLGVIPGRPLVTPPIMVLPAAAATGSARDPCL